MTITFTGGIGVAGAPKFGPVVPTSGDFPVNAVNFDGTNDNLERGGSLTGAVDGDSFLLSLWFNMIGGDGVAQFLFTDDSSRILLQRRSGGGFQFRLRSAAPSTLWEIDTTASYTTVSNPGWHHLLIATELDVSPVGQIYIDDVAAPFSVAEALAEGDIDWTIADYFIGSNQVPGSRFNGDMAEVYITNEYLDISNTSNRRKFIDTNGFPVDLGTTGNTPTGTAALVYLSGDTSTWHTNDGTGGGFTENGALTDASSTPSG